MKKISLIIVVLITASMFFTSCDEDINKEVNNIELLKETVPEEVLEKFNEEQKISLSKSDIDNKVCTYFHETFEIKYWSYNEFAKTGILQNKVFKILGANVNNPHGNIKSNLILEIEIDKNNIGKENNQFKSGKANINYVNSTNLKSDQFIINTVGSKVKNFDLENSLTKFYITDGTGNLKNDDGFAYVKFEIEKEATFGCYPNDKNYPDDFEDGTCAILNNCENNCEFGEGVAKMYMIGYICKN